MNLVHTTYSHLLPQQDDSPSLYSSTSTSSYIPDIPYENFTLSYLQNSIQRTTDDTSLARRDRRSRTNPYPTPDVSTSSMASIQYLPLYAPQPSQCINTEQSLNYSSNSFQEISFLSGTHNMIGHLDQFATQTDSTCVVNDFNGGVSRREDIQAHDLNSLAPRMGSSNLPTNAIPTHNSTEILFSRPEQILAPQVQYISQIPPVSDNSSPDLMHPCNPFSFIPQEVVPAQHSTHDLSSTSRNVPAYYYPPSSNKSVVMTSPTTFQTPVELLSDISTRSQAAQTKEIVPRRSDRSKARSQSQQHRQVIFPNTLGFVPTDPDTITSHDKKRLYLDCLENYVVYIHQQMRFAGIDPVPIERVSSGRGLVSRSIRTIIIHLRKMTIDLYEQKREAELKYMRIQALIAQTTDSSGQLSNPTDSEYSQSRAQTPKPMDDWNTGIQQRFSS